MIYFKLGFEPRTGIQLWRKPLDSEYDYMIDAVVSFNGVEYESEIDNNTYSPTEQGWLTIDN